MQIEKWILISPPLPLLQLLPSLQVRLPISQRLPMLWCVSFQGWIPDNVIQSSKSDKMLAWRPLG
jgi:hypothetical protein